MKLTRNLRHRQTRVGLLCTLSEMGRARAQNPRGPVTGVTHPVWTGLATGLMLSEVSVAGLLGMSESSSYSLEA